ncbi:MAG: AraC family transcriptional regulator [Anaerocolumna aminovalerica]|nr:AraC family transcriptional regulator [Anaerocolumna aminovalerica]MDU6265069.1 AraC family transcriptional regulator [Anaerocolumna aminovalerica]
MFKTYEIAYRVGFRDEKYFSKVFRKIKGMSPAEYKKIK